MNDDESLDDFIQKFGRKPLTQSQLDKILKSPQITRSEIFTIVDEVKLLRWVTDALVHMIENPDQQNAEVLRLARFLISAREER